jgi:phosphatidylinositol phospholipase C delta
VSVANDVSHIGAYFRVQLYHSGDRIEKRSKTVKCPDASERGHFADVKWDETLQFEYEDDGLVFLRCVRHLFIYNYWPVSKVTREHRIIVMHNVPFRRDTHQGVFVARTEYLEEGIHTVRLLNPKGKDSGATLLVRFTFEDL